MKKKNKEKNEGKKNQPELVDVSVQTCVLAKLFKIWCVMWMASTVSISSLDSLQKRRGAILADYENGDYKFITGCNNQKATVVLNQEK